MKEHELSTRVPITFRPDKVTVEVERGTTVLEAARAAGVGLAAGCGGRGTCGNCAVAVLVDGLEAPDDIESHALIGAPAAKRLACRARVDASTEVRVLASSAACTSSLERVLDGDEVVAGVDLGTSTVSAVVMSVTTGAELATATVENRQRTFGADVVSRLSAALSGSANDLQSLAEHSVSEALTIAANAAGISVSRLGTVAIAGNSVMMALLAGADPSGLASHPFAVPRLPPRLTATGALRDALGSTPVILLPTIASFVGADMTAGIISLGRRDDLGTVLLVDLGTNAEIALLRQDSLLVTSVPAGSALEGVGLYCGGPALPGGVERVEIIGDHVELHAIGDQEPGWFSGAGLISAVAALVRAGAVTADGLLVTEHCLADRIVTLDGGVIGVRLGTPESDLIVSQLDIRSLQLAKAALQVAIDRVLSRAEVAEGEVTELLIAGAFGGALDPHVLGQLGFIPENLVASARQIGNASLKGAAAVALDPDLLGEFAAELERARHIDLPADVGFGTALIAAMRFGPWRR